MRSVKPEFWADPSLARLSRDARLMYIALWNFADEHGRLFGDPRYIKGQVFPYDDDLTAAEVGELLGQLVTAGKIRPYSVGGDAYLFLPKLAKHQRLEQEKVPSRLPDPKDADPDPDPDGSSPDSNKSAPRADEFARDSDMANAESKPQVKHHEMNGANVFARGANELSLKQVAGSRLQVAGGREQVTTTSGADAPRTDTAQVIVGEWIEHCRKRPPGNVIGQTAKVIKQMLEEGIAADDVRRGMAAWSTKGLHPSALPSVVNEVMNGSSSASAPRRTASQKASKWLEMGNQLAAPEQKAIGS
jgi:hypothetical protein